jgi:hypothetical protein
MKTEQSKTKRIQFLEKNYPEIIKQGEDLIKEYDSKKNQEQIIKKDLWSELVKKYKPDSIDLSNWMSYLGLTKPRKSSPVPTCPIDLKQLLSNPSYEWVADDQIDWPAGKWVKK